MIAAKNLAKITLQTLLVFVSALAIAPSVWATPFNTSSLNAWTLNQSQKYDSQIVATQQIVITDELDSCQQTDVKLGVVDPYSHRSGNVQFRIYVPTGKSGDDLKTVLIVPPTGGENTIDHGYAENLCTRGLRSVIIQRWPNDRLIELDLVSNDQAAVRGLMAVRRVVDFLKPKRAGQIGILGTSLGAILSSIVISLDERITVGALVVGGGGLPAILSSTNEPSLARLRSARMKAFHLASPGDYDSAIISHLQIDPLALAPSASCKKILSIVALKDSTVPTASQIALYKAFGSQELITIDADHFGTVIRAYAFQLQHILDFFEKNLD